MGSVGQPRDDDARACFALYDTEQQKVWIKRVQYDIEAAIGKIEKTGLAKELGERLRWGR